MSLVEVIVMINIEASGNDIVYWGRNEDGSLYRFKDEDFHPFFYVPDFQGEYVSCFGEKLKKVMCRLPSDVPKERLLYEKHFEGDILYVNRYSIDRLGVLEKEPIKVCSIDIETESGSKAVQRFPDVNNPLNRITVIGVHNNFSDKYRIFCLGSECGFDKCEVEYFDDEIVMLKRFCKYVRTEDFDLFSGYYIDKFDMPYIINRMKKLNIDMTLLSRDTVQTYIDNYGHIHIWGRDTFDIYFGIRSLVSGERPSWKLNDVCQDELGYGKLDYDGELGELYYTDLKKFLEYNFIDVKLVVDLDKKFSMISFFDEIRRISKCSWSSVFTTNMVNDFHLLQFCKGRYILPSVSHREKEGYEGAHTEVYGTGLFKNVLMFDYKGLYPTIMMLYNISFETISSNFTDIPVGNGVYFMKKKLGIIPELLYSLFKKRNEYRDLMKSSVYGSDEYKRYKSIQKAYKILMNCFHPNTDIWTVDGIKNIKDVKVGDKVYSINPNTLELEEKRVIGTIKKYFSGELYSIKNREINLRVTPEHRFLWVNRNHSKDHNKTFFEEIQSRRFKHNSIPFHKKNKLNSKDVISLFDFVKLDKNKYIFLLKNNQDLRITKKLVKKIVPNIILTQRLCDISLPEITNFDDLGDLKKLYDNGYEIFIKVIKYRRGSKSIRLFYKNSLFSELIGWFISEGTLGKTKPKHYPNGNYRGKDCRISISQYTYVKEIEQLLKKLGYSYYKGESGFTISNPILHTIFKQFGSTSYEKFIPRKYFKLLDLEHLFYSMYLGDGHKAVNNYNTVSKKLAENVGEILFLLGKRFKIRKSKWDNKSYNIHFRDSVNWRISDDEDLYKEKYKGYVYCLNVEDNHTVFAGENYKMCWTGQSRYGDFGYVRSRIYNIKCAEAVTFIGKKIILKTIEVAKNFGLKVLYAHTDSIYFVIDDNVTRTKEELKDIGEKLSGQIESEVRKILPKSTLLPEVTLDLEFKEICLSAFFNEDVKSRNARLVVYDEGEFLKSPRLEITGFQSVRSDTPVLIQKLLNNVFTHILQGDKESDVLKIINDFSTDFINSKFDVRDISIPTSVNAEIPDDIVKGLSYHVKGSVFYNQHFSERTGKIKTGDKVRVCYVKVNSFGIDVISFTDKFPEKLEVDYKKMWERYKSVFLDLFGCMNWHSLSTGSFSLSQFSGKKTQTVNKDTVKTGGLFNFGVKKCV
jgi:DNA polymerase I